VLFTFRWILSRNHETFKHGISFESRVIIHSFPILFLHCLKCLFVDYTLPLLQVLCVKIMFLLIWNIKLSRNWTLIIWEFLVNIKNLVSFEWTIFWNLIHINLLNLIRTHRCSRSDVLRLLRLTLVTSIISWLVHASSLVSLSSCLFIEFRRFLTF